MAARAVVARRSWQRLVPGASLPLLLSPFVPSGCGGVRVSGLSLPAAANTVALSPAAALWARPRRFQHEGQPEQQPERSDQPIQMENPYKDPPKRCVLCGINVDYKNVQLLSQFVSPYTGSIYGRHITGLCNKKQKEITKAIKRAHVFGKYDFAFEFSNSRLLFY
ncbi:hypothetical protein Nmel_006721 [Mimus melanotis]